MTILPTGARLYVADPLPKFDRAQVKNFLWVKQARFIWLEIWMRDGRKHEVLHQPPSVDVCKIALEIMEACE